jgi:hypothetical protein
MNVVAGVGFSVVVGSDGPIWYNDICQIAWVKCIDSIRGGSSDSFVSILNNLLAGYNAKFYSVGGSLVNGHVEFEDEADYLFLVMVYG